MNTFFPYLFPLIISDLIILWLVVYGWRRRSQPVARLFSFVMICLLIWIMLALFEYVAPSLSGKLFLADISFIGIAYLPVFWLLLVIEYTEHQHQWARVKPWFFVIPTLTNLMIWTNPWHHWWRGVSTLDGASGPISLVSYDYQFWFYTIHAPHGYVLFALSLGLLIKRLVTTQRLYRWQISLLITSTLLPIFSDTLYVLDVLPLSNFNPTTIVFSLSGILLMVALFQFRFLDLTPIARNTLIDNMDDAMIVLDTQNRIVDLNHKMQALLGVQNKDAIGQGSDLILAKFGDQPAMLGAETAVSQEIAFEQNESTVYYDLSVSHVRNSGDNIKGRLIVLRDITARVHLENEMRLQNEELKAFSQMVAHDLKSPLGVVVGMSELLSSVTAIADDPTIHNYAEIIHQMAQKMDNIIESLLFLAHVRQQSIEMQSLDMNLIITEAKQRLYYDIEDAMATVETPDYWPIPVGYAPWIEEIWVNYLSNGLKYGGQPPHLTLGYKVQENGLIRFWVQDNGPGIRVKDQLRIFTPFTRLDTERADG
ncbi:MAG: PAS domain-containing protein, partial [Chloroflexi bacterium]